MRRLRFVSRVAMRAIALLLVSIVGAGATGLGHLAWDDPSCDPIPVHHDHNAHRFKPGRLPTSPAEDHCLACHSLRSLGTGLALIQTVFANDTHVAIINIADVVLAGRVLDSTAPSRAPPADLL